MLQIAYNDFFATLFNRLPDDPISLNSGGFVLPYLSITIIIYFTLTILIDKGIIGSPLKTIQKERSYTDYSMVERKDDDVEQEEVRVRQIINSKSENIEVLNLRKTYITDNKMEAQVQDLTDAELQKL